MVERTKLPETQKTSTLTIVWKEKEEEGGPAQPPRVPAPIVDSHPHTFQVRTQNSHQPYAVKLILKLSLSTQARLDSLLRLSPVATPSAVKPE